MKRPNPLLWSSFIALLFPLSYGARIDSNFSSKDREIRQNNYRGSYRFEVPSYLSSDGNARTVYSTDRRDLDGSYTYSYETDNAIKAKQESSGYGVNKVVRGYYSYIGSDGVPYTVNYIADRFGYRAYGAHLPTQPNEIYDQTKLPTYRPAVNSYYSAPSSSLAHTYPIQSQNYQTQNYSPVPFSTQPIYVSDASAQQNYINITPKPFASKFPMSRKSPISILPPHSNQFLPDYPYAWTTSNPLAFNVKLSSSAARPLGSY